MNHETLLAVSVIINFFLGIICIADKGLIREHEKTNEIHRKELKDKTETIVKLVKP